jgi:hypothetical protein
MSAWREDYHRLCLHGRCGLVEGARHSVLGEGKGPDARMLPYPQAPLLPLPPQDSRSPPPPLLLLGERRPLRLKEAKSMDVDDLYQSESIDRSTESQRPRTLGLGGLDLGLRVFICHVDVFTQLGLRSGGGKVRLRKTDMKFARYGMNLGVGILCGGFSQRFLITHTCPQQQHRHTTCRSPATAGGSPCGASSGREAHSPACDQPISAPWPCRLPGRAAQLLEPEAQLTCRSSRSPSQPQQQRCTCCPRRLHWRTWAQPTPSTACRPTAYTSPEASSSCVCQVSESTQYAVSLEGGKLPSEHTPTPAAAPRVRASPQASGRK